MSTDIDNAIPDGWSAVPLGELFSFKNGLNKGKAFFGHGTPIVNYMDVFAHSGLRSTDVEGLVDVTNAEKKAYSVRLGDVLFTRTSETPEEVGISAVLLDDIQNAVFSGFVLRGRPTSDRLKINFATHCFGSETVRSQIVSSATYTTRALTNGRTLSSVLLPLPNDPAEQHAISEALTDADGVIAGLERLIAKKRQIKQGAMQDLLTARRRLPGFSGEWADMMLRDLCSQIQDGTHFTPTYVDHGTPFYSVENITSRDFDACKYVTPIAHEAMAKRCRPRRGDILMTRIGSIGDTHLVTWDHEFSIYVSLVLLRPSDVIDAEYLYAYTRSNKFVLDVESHSLPNAIPKKINLGDVGEVKISYPISRSEQTAIATVLSDMDAEIQYLDARLTKARAVKEGMMQVLLTGRVRLV